MRRRAGTKRNAALPEEPSSEDETYDLAVCDPKEDGPERSAIHPGIDPLIFRKQHLYAVRYLRASQENLSSSAVEWLGRFIRPGALAAAVRDIWKPCEDELVRLDDAHDWQRKLCELWNDLKCPPVKRQQFIRLIMDCGSSVVEDDSPLKKKLDEVSKVFRLSVLERECLFFLYMKGTDSVFEAVLRDGGWSNSRDFHFMVRIMSVMTGLEPALLTQTLRNDRPLMKYRILDEHGEPENGIIAFISGLDPDPVSSSYYSRFQGDVLPLSSFACGDAHVELMKRMIETKPADSGLHFLFYGTPGTGKTAMAASLAAAAGKQLYSINLASTDSNYRRSTDRMTALYACTCGVNLRESIILVDEADDLLNSGEKGLSFLYGSPGFRGGGKGAINEFIDRTEAACIWISNRHDGIEDSVRRRFDYSLHFPSFSTAQRLRIWENVIGKYGMAGVFDGADISRLASRHRVSAGGIEIAVRTLSRLGVSGADKTDAEKTLERILERHRVLMDEAATSSDERPTENYSLSGLNIRSEIPPSDCISILRGFGERMGLEPEPDARNLNVLLHGPPGTGKTEYAKFIAGSLGKPLMIRRSSDLLDPYVGMTERRIAEAFRQAESDQAVLFLDEADSLLFSRDHATRRFEVSQVNELLVAMETFRGILICSTNDRKKLDAAALRRFTLKIEFDYLTETGKRIFWDLYLSSLAGGAADENFATGLSEIGPLAPGDFKVVRQKYRFYEGGAPGSARLLEALANEVAIRGGKTVGIGFGG
jgi:SpoVK/Ycf46/Vps4 family AAA+-type ATPase